jgi:signal transduction histidine kinase
MPSIKPARGKQKKSMRKSLSQKKKETAAKEQHRAGRKVQEKKKCSVQRDVSTKIFKDSSGNKRTGMIIRDLTDRRQAKEALGQSESNLRALAMELSRAEERERHRLAIYLHDEIGQSLALLQMKLDSFANASKSKSDKHDIKVLRDLLETIIEQTHTLTFELSPPVLHQLGLEAAIEWAGEKISRDHGLDFTFNDDGMAKSLNPDLQAILFRCVRELMLNTVKHAKAKRLTVAIAREGEKILYTIADDGLGFDPSLHDTRTEETGFGLLSVREHLATMGGNCRIQSTPGQGTRITLTVPVGGGAPEERDAACRMTDGSLIPENEPR